MAIKRARHSLDGGVHQAAGAIAADAKNQAGPAAVITLDTLRQQREPIMRLAAQRGARRIQVFGSVARGTADAESDVDLLIELPEPRPRGFRYVGLITGLEEDLCRLLNRPVHVTELRDPSPEFATRIEREAVPL